MWSAVEADPGDEPALLTLLVDHAEQIRAERDARGPLVCYNIALFGPTDDHAARRLMERPVWLARNLYAPVQVVVDRFWIGAGRRPGRGRDVFASRLGHPVPDPAGVWEALMTAFPIDVERICARKPAVG